MKHKASMQRMTHRLALAVVVAAGLATVACEPRPRDPKPPSDPGRHVPKPITGAALPTLTASTAFFTLAAR